ncbi:hypothetical protein FACS1894151_10520 [Spirochaetia bacterium]|nr:hypothetical protein FACS1894151_10520 [Spirochaetia bacterium]
MLLVLIIGTIGAIDTESYQFIDHLLGLSAAGGPELYEDGILFTASGTNRRVGIAFAHEGFAKVYWFQKLLVPGDGGIVSSNAGVITYRDTGILFHVYVPPTDMKEIEYRLVMDGLWTVDPLNPARRIDPRSGIARSIVALPNVPPPPSTFSGPPGSLHFSYKTAAGESVTVAGNFNGWDPFMYELKEISPGNYDLVLPLPPGTYQYMFYHRGERILDPNNPSRVYTPAGEAVSQALVR